MCGLEWPVRCGSRNRKSKVLTPKKLSGKVVVPPSKSVAHRMIIAAALSDGVSTISNLFPSVDITATMDCMKALGAKISFSSKESAGVGAEDWEGLLDFADRWMPASRR